MKRVSAKQLESIVDSLASVSLSGAVGVFVYQLLEPLVHPVVLGAGAAAAALIAYGASRLLLAMVGRPVVRPLGAAASEMPQAVISISPVEDSPVVVRLFDRAAFVATPATGPISAAPQDASESLHEALNQLRRSLASRR